MKTIEGLGMPFYGNSKKHGNLYVQFEIAFPTTLNITQKEEISKVSLLN
jgi:DnaJ-class molecular chaperone